MKMLQSLPDYKFYPSLLDSYKWYQQSESETAEQELLDKINRKPYQSDAVDKGTWFNELVDLSLKGLSIKDGAGENKHALSFITGCLLDCVNVLAGSAKQVYTSTIIEVDGKMVELYGYIDFVKEDRVIDLKTTKTYELGKYKNSLQLHFYPVSLIDEGNEINSFEFLVCDFENVYSESYRVNYETSLSLLKDACRELIRFIEIKKDLITDRKIFGQSVILAEHKPELNTTLVSEA